ncbi:MAG TPA: LytTR family DNA-binding domain-containing protein [Flavisolibacter sp.]|nr:LytTR family DNA-binding domain-containing protein [Flavisolibacter sp.]
MQIKAVIVEDEVRSRELLHKLIGEFCPDVQVAGLAASVEEAIALIDRVQPSLVFMDIELHSGTGFDVLQRVKASSFHLIFTTAYDHYAVRAIKFSAIDYLLKPIDVEELQQAVEKVKGKVESDTGGLALQMLLKNLNKPAGTDFSITLSTSEGLEFIPLQTIIRLESSGPYTYFFLKGGKKIMVSKNLKEYELLLSEHQFFRVHNSHMVNLREVTRMIKTDGGYAIMSDGSQISISPKKREAFLGLISQRMV